jgi:hypothetical protein
MMALNSYTPNQGFQDFSTLVYPTFTPATYADTATVTAADLLGGFILATKNGAATLTLPTAALLNAAIPGAAVGRSFEFFVRNTGNNTYTIGAGTGGTSATGNTMTVATVNTRTFLVRITGVANGSDPASSDTYTIYSTGVSAH